MSEMRRGGSWGHNKRLKRDNGVVGDKTGTESFEDERPAVKEETVKKEKK